MRPKNLGTQVRIRSGLLATFDASPPRVPYHPPFYGSPTHNTKGGWWLALVSLVHRHTTIKGAPVAWAPKPRLRHATEKPGNASPYQEWSSRNIRRFSSPRPLLRVERENEGEKSNNKGGAPPPEPEEHGWPHSPNRPRHKPRKT